MPLNRSALRNQLLLWLLIPLGLVWLIGAAVTYQIARNFSNIAYDRSLFESTRALATQVKVLNHRVVLDLPQAALDLMQSDQYDHISFQIKDMSGSLITGDPGIPDPRTEPGLAGLPIFYTTMSHGRRVRVAALYLHLMGETHRHDVWVKVAETLVKREDMAREILADVVLPQLILILMAAVSVWVGVRKGLSPLQRVQRAISSRSHRDLSPVDEQDAPDEVRPLLHAINDFMGRLGKVLTMQRRFIADAAHQLRTPLAGLKTQTELALRQTDPDSLHRALRQIALSAERTARLANQLLSLARTEPEAAHQREFSPLDLATLARCTTSDWVPTAIQKNIDLGFEGPEGQEVKVLGDAFLLGEMLANLLDNAIRYTPEGGRVTVHLSGGLRPILTVEDTGPGIPPEEREHVFERFYRILGSNTDGSGLGLAIVREIALIHQARIELGSPDHGSGTRILVQFPALK